MEYPGHINFPPKGKSDFVVSWNGPVADQRSPKSYAFLLKGQHITVEPLNHWHENIPVDAQKAIFNALLSQYRKRSEHMPQIAAIGIMSDGSIFTGLNTQDRDNEFSRDCAEQNMIHAFSQSKKRDPDAKLIGIHIMGGQEPSPSSKWPSIVCPCGNCTDTLALKMNNPDAPVIVYPVNEGVALPDFVSVDTVLDLKPGQGWETTIGHLSRKARTEIKGSDAKRWMKRGEEELLEYILADHPQEWRTSDFLERSRHRAAENIVEEKRSNAEIEVLDERGMLDNEVHTYLKHHIRKALRSRLHDDDTLRSLSTPAEQIEYMRSKIRYAAHAFVRLSDGSFQDITTVQSEFDKSSPPAGTLVPLLNQGSKPEVQELWYMEYNPKLHVQHLMPAPNNDSIERNMKRGSKVRFHVYPLMRSGLSREHIKQHSLHADAIDMSPGYFRGRGPLEPLTNGVANITSEARHPVSLALIDKAGGKAR